MSPKKPHTPSIIPNLNALRPAEAGGSILTTEQGMEQLIAERNAKAQHHLDELAKNSSIENSALNAVVLAGIQNQGVPAPDEQAEFFDRCQTLAKRISDHQQKGKYQAIKSLLKELNIHNAPPALIWSAKQNGVELFGDDKH